ncbi:hypothetical protein C7377_1850 [Balneicella halophila]|uniref:Uncharacterized protein n=1 Tax=Balneicella halophila TaxID=1537566 RepID=A0A7L4UNV6_BALHA|nr:hypothetical protein C7377_1850 [Balneicella halophila]
MLELIIRCVLVMICGTLIKISFFIMKIHSLYSGWVKLAANAVLCVVVCFFVKIIKIVRFYIFGNKKIATNCI